MSRTEIPEQARKIRDREALEVERQARDAERQMTSAASALSAVCRLMTLRQRYMGAVGEHYSVQDFEGILVVDYLDERVVRSLGSLLDGFAERVQRVPASRATELIQRSLPRSVNELPQYPVAYVVLYVLRQAVEAFQGIREQAEGVRRTDLEHALMLAMRNVVQQYVETRDRPVQRHFSDVEREYSSVMRLRCNCGEEKFQVMMQSLHAPEDETPYDQLDLQCQDCGNRRTVTFDLPYFKDMYQL